MPDPSNTPPPTLPDLGQRVAELEAYVKRNDARITALEAWGAAQATALTRRTEMLDRQARRDRWRLRRRR